VENDRKRRYDESLESVLVKWKVELDAENQVVCRFISYDNARPRLECLRWYQSKKDGKWYYASKLERLAFDVIVSIVKHTGEIERAMEEWTRKHGPDRSGAPRDSRSSSRGGRAEPPA
jgi:hypothetical protein